MSFDPAPILLFVFNRPSHTRRTLKALSKNSGARESELIIFSDGPRNESDKSEIAKVRELIKHVDGFKCLRVVEQESNLGLAESILTGVSGVLAEQDSCIVLEDDLITAPSFLSYMNGALNAYKNQASLLSVSGYLPPRWRMPRPKKPNVDVWLNPRNLSFGWGTWSEKWASVNWNQAKQDRFEERRDLQNGFAHGGADLPGMLMDQLQGNLNSWAVRFSYAHYRQGAYSLMPAESYVKPIGFDGSGMHCRPNPTRWFENTKRAVKNPEFPEHPEVDQDLTRALRKSFDRHHRLAQWLKFS